MTVIPIKIKRREKPGNSTAEQAARLMVGSEPLTPPASAKSSIVGTEDWAGEKLAEYLRGRAYWLEASGRWIMWDGKKWNTEAGALLMREALRCARRLSAEGAKIDDKALISTIRARHSARGAAAALIVARSWLIGDHIKWNPDPHLLNCANGVVNLKTGELLAHHPDFYMTMITPVSYLEGLDAQCPNFLATLRKFQPSAEVQEYLQRQYGYRATGEVGERAFFCQIGGGSNGKSTIENMFARALGEYHAEVAGGLFLQALNATFAKDPNSHSEALFAIRYKRNVLLKEPDNRHRLDESLIKQFTDGQNAVYRSRTLHKEGVDTPVTQKIVFYSNNPPQMSASRSITNRLHAVVWGVTLSKAEEDPNFPARFLVPELPGILRWIVEGARRFYAKEGKLGRPTFLEKGEEAYRAGSDPLGDFVDQYIFKEPGRGMPLRDFYNRYVDFCERTKAKPRGISVMKDALEPLGLTVSFHNKGTKHPDGKGGLLNKELRWVSGGYFMDQ